MGSVEIFSSPEELAKAAAEKIVQRVNEADGAGSRITIALSGGETPKLLFSALYEKYHKKADWSKADFYWVDERCVPPDDPDSNFGAANNLFFSRIEIPESSVHRIRGEADPEKEAVRYSEEIQRNVPSVNDLPSFGLIILGIGNDGHTASIFPGSNDLFETGDICSVEVHPEKKQKRVTLTGTTINNASEVIFLVSGESKAEIISSILRRREPVNYPASLVHPRSGRLVWMMDSDAASLLENDTPPTP